MIHFVAVLGIVEEENCLQRSDEYSYILIGFMYYIRVLFIEHALLAATRGEQTRDDIDQFLKLQRGYLVVRSYSLCSFLIKMLGYRKTISMQKINQPSITQSRLETNCLDSDVLELYRKLLLIRRFKEAIYDMIQEAEDILWQDLMWVRQKKDWFKINLDLIQDDLSLAARSALQVTNEANGIKDKTQQIMDQMLKALKDQQLQDQKVNTWQMSRVWGYRQLQRRFKELALALGYKTLGLLARREEITPIRFQNGFLQERNIYIINRRMCYVTRYHKLLALFREAKVILRFLLQQVGQLFAVYLAYVQPFLETLNQKTNGLLRSDYLQHDKNGLWTTVQLTKVLTQETAARMGIWLMTQDYQNVAIDIGCEYIRVEFIRDIPTTEEMPHEDSDVVVSAVDLAAAHRKEIVEQYGVYRDIIQNLSNESIQIFRAIRTQWHQLLSLDSRKLVPLGKRERGLSYRTLAPSLNPKRSRSLLGRAVLLIFTPLLTSPSQGGFLTLASLSQAGNEIESQFKLMMLPSQLQPEAVRTRVLQLAKVLAYSEEEIYEGLKKVLNQEELKFRSDEQEEAVYVALN